MRTLTLVVSAVAAAMLLPAAFCQNNNNQDKGMPVTYKDIQFPALPEFKPAEPIVKDLPNGLRVYFMEDHELPLVRVRAMLRAGSAYEPEEKTGLATICAQVMRTGGTVKNPGDHLDDELGAIAASVDLSMGGFSAAASAGCLSDKLNRVLDIFADVLRNPAFPEDKIELAKSALRTGISRRNDQIGAMAQRAFQIAVYGKNSILAREAEYATVNAVTRADLVKFHNTYFRADRTMIGIVGDFKTAEVLPIIEKLFGDWQKASEPLPKAAADPLPFDGRKVYFSEKNDVNQTNLYISAIGVRRDDPDWPALRVGSFVLGAGGFSSRLLKKVRTEKGLAYSVGGGFGAEYDRVGLFRTVCQTKTQSTADAIQTMLDEIEGMLKNPPSEEEIKLAKDQILNAEVFEYDDKAEVLARRMTLDYYKYPPTYLEDVNRKIRTVSAADVAAALKRKLDTKNLKFVAVGKRDGMDKPLSTFGPVTEIDLTIPDPPAAKAAVASSADTNKAIANIFSKLGDVEKWKSLRALRNEVERSQTMQGFKLALKVTEHLDLAGRSHASIQAKTPMGEENIIQVYDHGKAWMTRTVDGAPQTTDIPAAMLKSREYMRKIEYSAMFHRLAAGELKIGIVKENELQIIEGDAVLATLIIDAASGLPKELHYNSEQGQPATRVFNDFRAVDGILFPFEWSAKDGVNDPSAKFSKIELNPAIDEKLFQK